MLAPCANTFGLAYQMGFIAHNDVTGRLSSLIAAVVALASMACTNTGGMLIEAYGYPPFIWFVAALIASSVLILFISTSTMSSRITTIVLAQDYLEQQAAPLVFVASES